MIRGGLTLGLITFAALATAVQAQPATDDQRVWRQWALNCQGCHQPQGLGVPGATPALQGQVARFTATPEGRAYLGRVPGVANAPLSDQDLAALLNWLLVRFDRNHLSPTFRPYAAAEVAELRARPLRSEAAAVRAELVRRWPAESARRWTID
ncbi:MAG TPA: cytochrome c [Phenylobacterium sp.]